MPGVAFQGGIFMRIHDSMLEINTRSRNNTRTNKNLKSTAASENGSTFLECLTNFQANPIAACQDPGAQRANVVWVHIPQGLMSKHSEKIKSGAYQALSEI